MAFHLVGQENETKLNFKLCQKIFFSLITHFSKQIVSPTDKLLLQDLPRPAMCHESWICHSCVYLIDIREEIIDVLHTVVTGAIFTIML